MSGLPWYRFYQDALDDEVIQREHPVVFKAWVNCLSIACRKDGLIPPVDGILWHLRMIDARGIADVTKAVARLVTIGYLIEVEGGYRAHDWDRRIFVSDNSTFRSQKSRENARISEPIKRPRGRPRKDEKYATLHASPQVNNSETLRASGQIRKEKIKLEGDTDESENAREAHSHSNGRTPKKREAIPIPEPFDVTDAMLAWAAGKGYEAPFIEWATEYFVNWAKAHDHRYVLWDRVWMNILDSKRPEWLKRRGITPLERRA
jgi:hypothetical protein